MFNLNVFRYGVTLFKPNFLIPPWSKMKNFSGHQKAEDLRISKLTLLLFLVPFLGELRPLKHGELFFGTPCTYKCTYTKDEINFLAGGDL